MGLEPKIRKEKPPFFTRTCKKCEIVQGPGDFIKTKSFLFKDGYLPICNTCIEEHLSSENFNWRAVDKLCQLIDIPFIPREFERLKEMNGEKVFPIYAEVFLSSDYENIGWGDYFEEFRRLQEQGAIEEELPILDAVQRKKLKEKWGKNYDDDALKYMEDLYQSILRTQNVSGSLQLDQAIKICRISYDINTLMGDGAAIDKLLSSYDKLIRSADFTPKNTKSAGDFESVGELVRWLERRGFRNKFYDGERKDIVDETIQNIQSYLQRLYTNESGISEEITKKIEALNNVAQLESYYGTDTEYELDNFEKEGYEKLFSNADEEVFKIDLEEEEEDGE